MPRLAPALVLLALAGGCVKSAPSDTSSAKPAKAASGDAARHAAEVEAWHAKRIASLKKEHGWLSLIGLEWLEEGENTVGSDPDSAVVLRGKAPAKVGALVVSGTQVRFVPAAPGGVTRGGAPVDVEIALATSAGGTPDKLQVGSIAFVVIERGGKLAARIWDAEATTRTAFHGIDRFPVDARWRVEARWEPYATPKTVLVPTVIPGYEEESTVPGAAVFTLEGKEHRLEPTKEEGDDQLFFVFGDTTNGPETYGAGRFLYTALPENGRVVLDFNRAYNPPCAFTPYATCPLAREENRLPLRVEAGEKNASDH